MDAFTPGFLLTIIGMGVVFGSLIVLMVVIQLLERFFSGGRAGDAGAEGGRAAPGDDDLEVVLAAAAGYFLETEGPEVRVPNVRRAADSAWARAARPGRSLDPWSRR